MMTPKELAILAAKAELDSVGGRIRFVRQRLAPSVAFDLSRVWIFATYCKIVSLFTDIQADIPLRWIDNRFASPHRIIEHIHQQTA